MLSSPKIQGYRRKFIDDWDGAPILRQVYRLNVAAATIASLNADMADNVLRGIKREFPHVFFTAGVAQNSAIVPLVGAERANQRALRSVAFPSKSASNSFLFRARM